MTFRKSPLQFALVVGPLLAATLAAQLNFESQYRFTTLAGAHLPDGLGAVDGIGSAARFNGPNSMAIDSMGNLYAADRLNHTIRKIAPDGTVTTLAGSPGATGSADGIGSAARFNYPYGVAVNSAGNIYVADSMNHTIRMITPNGVVSTLAGSPGLSGANDGQGAAARFAAPKGVAVDSAGNVYVADTYNCTVRKISPTGAVSTLAGYPGQAEYIDGTGASARLVYPLGVAVDGTGNVYVSDEYTVRKITSSGVVSTLAGAPRRAQLPGSFDVPDSYHDGVGVAASFEYPAGLTVDGAGNVYVTDTYNHAIRKITPGGVVTLLAGGPPVYFFYKGPVNGTSYSTYISQSGSVDGIGAAARFKYPTGLALDANGNLYVADSGNFTLRKVTSAGIVTTFAGTAGQSGVVGGNTSIEQFNLPCLAIGDNGTLVVADTNNHTIRAVSAGGVVTTIAGLKGQPGSADGSGITARFNLPQGIATDSSGVIYVADTANHTIRKITPAGDVTTFAGVAGQSGVTNGVGAAARFNSPRDLALDGAGTLYVLDSGNGLIRKIAPDGTVTSFTGASAGSYGLAVDYAGTVYIPFGASIRKITPTGVVSTFAGVVNAAGSTDGVGAAARFERPYWLSLDGAGNLYVADLNFGLIRKITPAGVVTTLASVDGPSPWTLDGIATQLYFPSSTLAVDSSGNIYTSNRQNEIIKGEYLPPSATISITAQPQDLTVTYGYPFRLSVTATGDSGLSYQWQKAHRSPPSPYAPTVYTPYVIRSDYEYSSVLGATGSELQIDDATGGYYRVLITDSSGTVSSRYAAVTTVVRGYMRDQAADFNGDGNPDLLWENSTTRERAIWFMDGTNFQSSSTLGFFEPGWSIAATGDFNGDGKTDIVWSSDITGERAVWLMNGPYLLDIATFGIFPLEWTVAATGDFDGDRKPDLVWSNRITGERALWLMDGTKFKAVWPLGVFPLEWTVAAIGDFNADGKPDIVWSNSITGERALWLMNGTNLLRVSTLGIFPLEWTITGTADFNRDGKVDIIWSNNITGERAFWLMNGTNFLGASTLGIFPLEWTVKN